jgi:hypothetical protein
MELENGKDADRDLKIEKAGYREVRQVNDAI